jgi:tetratricopeptide (TPR) repeat protein
VRFHWTFTAHPPYYSGVNVDVSIDPEHFIKVAQPLLQAKDAQGLQAALCSRWTKEQIMGLLVCSHPDAPKVAALALALVGGRCCIDALARQLHHRDPMVVQMSEHALWTIWFRLGKPDANHHVCRGSQALNRRDFQHADCHFSKALQIDPTFAEAANQRAITHYLQEKFEDSLKDCLLATRLMPCHFGAWAGMGHCHAHLGQLEPAIHAYERALQIHPKLECIGEAIAELRRRCDQ